MLVELPHAPSPLLALRNARYGFQGRAFGMLCSCCFVAGKDASIYLFAARLPDANDHCSLESIARCFSMGMLLMCGWKYCCTPLGLPYLVGSCCYNLGGFKRPPPPPI